MLDEKLWKTLQKVLEDKNLPKEFRATLASIMKSCYENDDEDLFKIVHDVTNAFNIILYDGIIKEYERTGKKTIQFLPEISLKKGQHAILITQDGDEAKEIASRILSNHRDNALLFNISPKYVTWIKNKLSKINNKSVFYFTPPIDTSVITSSKKFDSKKASTIVMSNVTKALGQYPFVKAVTLATSEYVFRLSDLDWESFFDYEDDGSIVIKNQPMTWLCLYSFEDLTSFNDIKKLLTMLSRCARAHHVVMIRTDNGQIFSGLDALVRCYELVLKQHLNKIQV